MNSWELPESYDYKGRNICYGRLGEGPPMVLVHGTPWSSFNLRHLIQKLSREYTVYFFDLLGYGQSSKDEGDVSLGIQNKVLDCLLNHWKLDDPIIVGHDFGGATALRTHLLNGRRFKKIILIDPVAVSPWGSPFFRHVNAHEAAFAELPDYIHEAVVRAYVQTAAFKPLDDTTLNGIVLPWISRQGKAAFYRQMAQADSKYTDEAQRLYHTITTPTLILWGREDNWIPLERGEELHNMIPGSALRIIDDAGHLVIEEKPGRLIKEILDFIQA
ncbi:pimeloyl-ACP methyl ester carboxylesterase [Pseudomonas duriflava]|uniref:Pimeloyl-ACP methyl ester carboxylesterase n=1 Tax=Pseudomonas duriflava TaxID=459528 RepID=A0A562QA92_9PSED|nr:alpha/beta hydrolase [Pseudomonas duriflava]TWI53672.1 pimeloyl-ACP methyl ester carboxylesterase [Pseudomonas duriflava]